MLVCPSRERLQRLLAEELAGSDLMNLEAHIEKCPACQVALEQLTSTVPTDWRRADPDTPSPDRMTFLKQLMENPPPPGSLSLGPLSLVAAGLPPTRTNNANNSRRLPRIPGYEMQEKLGEGVSGIVYMARQLSTDRLVAVKVLRSEPSGRGAVRFRREVDALAWVRHPNLVRIFEIGEYHGRPFFAMEYVSGGSLDRLLAQGPLTPGPAARLMATIARGMQAAHTNGIIHRDLKPANILLTAECDVPSAETENKDQRYSSLRPPHSEFPTPKIADFGLAKHRHRRQRHTQTGAILGTPHYMAPEQATADGTEVGPPADVYALGAIFYEALTGQPPFQAESVPAVLERVRYHQPTPIRSLRADVPMELEAICLRCLQKDPKRRYPSAGPLADDLERYLKTGTLMPPLAVPVTLPVSGPLPRRFRGIVRMVAAITLLAALAAGMLLLVLAAGNFHAENGGRALKSKPGPPASAAPSALATRSSIRPLLPLLTQPQPTQPVATKPTVDPPPPPPDDKPRRFTIKNTWDLGVKHKSETACLSPDGRWIALAAGRRRLILLGLSNHKELVFVAEHAEAISTIAFTADGRHIAAGAADGTILLHETATGMMTARTRAGDVNLIGPVSSIAFVSAGRVIAGIASKVRLVPSKEPTSWDLRGRVHAVAVSPDGNTYAFGAEDGFRFWSLDRNDYLGPVTLLDGTRRICFSPDGKLLATGSADRTVAVWEVATGRKRHGFTADAAVTSLAFAPGSQQLASGSASGSVQIWDLKADQKGQTLEGLKGAILSLVFTADGDLLAASGGVLSVRAWKAGLEDRQPMKGERN